MRILKVFIFLLTPIWIFISCDPSSSMLASESVQEGMVFCNPFDIQGFQGVLFVTEDRLSYDKNTSMLFFNDVPDSFNTQEGTYIQLHGANFHNNKHSFSNAPFEMDVLNLRNDNPTSITDLIDREFIQNQRKNDRENYRLNDFFADHALVIKNTAGWKALHIGLYNVNDDLILDKNNLLLLLIPPFEANPYIYEESNSNNQALSKLHPFSALKTSIERTSDDVFLSKAESACLETPI